MTLYLLRTWSHGRWHYATGLEFVQFVQRRSGARLYSRQQANEVRRRFRKVRLQLKLEPHADVARAPAIDARSHT